MFQDSVPAGSYNDPFLSSVWVSEWVCVCVSEWVWVSVSEEGGREGGGGGRGADTELKTKTPHVNVGKNGDFQ